MGNRYAFCTQYMCYYARKPIYIKNQPFPLARISRIEKAMLFK